MFEALLLTLLVWIQTIVMPVLTYAAAYLYTPLKFAIVPLGAVLNRIRGGGYLPVRDPPRSGLKMWCVAALMGLMACVFWPPLAALAIGLALVVWDMLLPWGRWYTFNRFPRSISADYTWPERLIEMVSDLGGVRRDRVAFYIRNLIAFAAAAAVLAFAIGTFQIFLLVPVAALIQNIAYEIGWRLSDHIDGPSSGTGIHYSEHAMGAAFGAMIGFGATL